MRCKALTILMKSEKTSVLTDKSTFIRKSSKRLHNSSQLQLESGVNRHNSKAEIFRENQQGHHHPITKHVSVISRYLRRKLTDALDQVLVRSPLPGDQLAHYGDDLEGVLVVQPSKE
ncbi:Urease accessory protein UreD, partial [Frankliniella fusca]